MTVVWTEGETPTGLFKKEMPPNFGGISGEYGVQMYGVLYPTYLEIRFPERLHATTKIIPINHITQIEFGESGVR